MCQSGEKCGCVWEHFSYDKLKKQKKNNSSPSIHRKIQFYVTLMCLINLALWASPKQIENAFHVLRPIDAVSFLLLGMHLNLHKSRIFFSEIKIQSEIILLLAIALSNALGKFNKWQKICTETAFFLQCSLYEQEKRLIRMRI